MAVPNLPGSFTSQADYDRKVDDQLKYLRLRSKLNAIAERSTTRILAGVQPLPPGPRNLDEEELDKQQQMGLAVQNLTPITGQPVAFDFINTHLRNREDLQEFNDYFKEFQNNIRGNATYTADQLNSDWQRYKRSQMAETDGASIYPLQQEADYLGYEIMNGVSGGSLQVAQLQEVVNDAVRRFDIPTLKALRRRVYG
jgi:hypothetical protein